MPLHKRILCVEDDEDTCFVLTQLFEQEGYEVLTARSVNHAIELSSKGSFNLYILDTWLMEGKGSGTDLCQKMREFDPQTPIIFYSGAAFESDKEEALRVGATAFIAKPYIEELIETVRRLLDF